MKLKNRYFILRHGQTIYQVKKVKLIYPESRAIRITKKGEKQIKSAALKLRKERVDLIFSSDAFRTQQTAKIVARELKVAKIHFDKKLRDINVGVYRGRTKQEFYRDFPLDSPSHKKLFSKKPKNGESWQDCQKRMVNFLKKIDGKHKDKTILIVSHGDPLWLLEGWAKKTGIKKLFRIKSSKKGYVKTGELRKL